MLRDTEESTTKKLSADVVKVFMAELSATLERLVDSCAMFG